MGLQHCQQMKLAQKNIDIPAIPLLDIPAIPLLDIPAIPLLDIPAIPLFWMSNVCDCQFIRQPTLDIRQDKHFGCMQAILAARCPDMKRGSGISSLKQQSTRSSADVDCPMPHTKFHKATG
jgi:hypothetical protein